MLGNLSLDCVLGELYGALHNVHVLVLLLFQCDKMCWPEMPLGSGPGIYEERMPQGYGMGETAGCHPLTRAQHNNIC